MPELPEVETVVRELRPHLIGRKIAAVRVSRKRLRRRWAAGWAQALAGQRVEEVRRRGKWILICLAGNRHLVIHLGMTGQLTIVPAATAVADHTHLVFSLDRGSRQMRFRDVRRFGSATLFHDSAEMSGFFEDAGLGPEPFDVEPAYLQERLANTRRCLKAVLLDQRVVAGVGNIYADESLFEARLHPAQLGAATSPQQARRLQHAIVTVLERAIEKRGSSIRDYIGGSGQRGAYQEEFRVYGRTGEPCSRCQAPIVRVRLAGRSTHFCACCQEVRGAKNPQGSKTRPGA